MRLGQKFCPMHGKGFFEIETTSFPWKDFQNESDMYQTRDRELPRPVGRALLRVCAVLIVEAS